jgi:hypothetical protein
MQYRYWIFLNIPDIISSEAKEKAENKANCSQRGIVKGEKNKI